MILTLPLEELSGIWWYFAVSRDGSVSWGFKENHIISFIFPP
jgi:hypothetical protein